MYLKEMSCSTIFITGKRQRNKLPEEMDRCTDPKYLGRFHLECRETYANAGRWLDSHSLPLHMWVTPSNQQ